MAPTPYLHRLHRFGPAPRRCLQMISESDYSGEDYELFTRWLTVSKQVKAA